MKTQFADYSFGPLDSALIPLQPWISSGEFQQMYATTNKCLTWHTTTGNQTSLISIINKNLAYIFVHIKSTNGMI